MLTIPDKGEGISNLQSALYQEQIDALMEGIAGRNCVLFGLAVTGGADMTPDVAKGAVLSGGVMFAVAAGTVTIGTADGSNPRFDLIVVNASGALAVRAGTAAAAPKPPARTADDVLVAVVYVPAGATAIATGNCIDGRVVRANGLTVYRQTTADTINNTASAIALLNRSNSGVTIPSGLLLAGTVLRLRMGGNILFNSGTPTFRIVVAFGGTTMFSDISGASTADADRTAWHLDINIIGQGTSDQAMVAETAMGIIATKTAPTTGIGDAWSTAQNVGAISGSAAVNADTGDRLLSVQGTFSVANAANEVVVEYATLELV